MSRRRKKQKHNGKARKTREFRRAQRMAQKQRIEDLGTTETTDGLTQDRHILISGRSQFDPTFSAATLDDDSNTSSVGVHDMNNNTDIRDTNKNQLPLPFKDRQQETPPTTTHEAHTTYAIHTTKTLQVSDLSQSLEHSDHSKLLCNKPRVLALADGPSPSSQSNPENHPAETKNAINSQSTEVSKAPDTSPSQPLESSQASSKKTPATIRKGPDLTKSFLPYPKKQDPRGFSLGGFLTGCAIGGVAAALLLMVLSAVIP